MDEPAPWKKWLRVATVNALPSMEQAHRVAPEFSGPKPLLEILTAEWRWWLPGAVLAFVLASVLMSGWPHGLVPDIEIPFMYHGDSLFHAWMAERTIEGWVFDNPRSGYPFGSNFLDYPGSDAANHLLTKLLGIAGGSYAAALNLYFLLGFPTAFIASYCVQRSLGLSKFPAASGAILFVFLPFHFQRLTHLFYTWYASVPLFFYVGIWLYYFPDRERDITTAHPWRVRWLSLLALLAAFGVYYAAFGTLLIVAGSIAGTLRNRNPAALKWGALAATMVIAGVALNVAPNAINRIENGPNAEVAVRHPAEAEIYGLKLIQLILPRNDHRLQALSELRQLSERNRPLVNENGMASLGAVGSAGLLVLALVVLCRLSGVRIDSRLAALALFVWLLFLFGTIGGLGSVFSTFISPSLRAWNRDSIFIGFGCIAVSFLSLQLVAEKLGRQRPRQVHLIFVSAVLAIVGLLDQTTGPCPECRKVAAAEFNADRQLVNQVEAALPSGAAVYQLPYMPFPEVRAQHKLETYGHAVGFLHSKALRWNWGGMKGREGDLFYRKLSTEPIARQLQVIERLGFSAIYVDRRGYADGANSILADLSSALGAPLATRADGQILVFRLPPGNAGGLTDLTPQQIIQKGLLPADGLGDEYAARLTRGIEFTEQPLSPAVRSVSGLSPTETWGRWSDARLAPSVTIEMAKPLPQKFTLVLVGQAFGPNVDRHLTILVGTNAYKAVLTRGVFQLRIPIDTRGQAVNALIFTPPQPTSPEEIGLSADVRKLGIGFIRLKFDEPEAVPAAQVAVPNHR